MGLFSRFGRSEPVGERAGLDAGRIETALQSFPLRALDNETSTHGDDPHEPAAVLLIELRELADAPAARGPQVEDALVKAVAALAEGAGREGDFDTAQTCVDWSGRLLARIPSEGVATAQTIARVQIHRAMALASLRRHDEAVRAVEGAREAAGRAGAISNELMEVLAELPGLLTIMCLAPTLAEETAYTRLVERGRGEAAVADAERAAALAERRVRTAESGGSAREVSEARWTRARALFTLSAVLLMVDGENRDQHEKVLSRLLTAVGPLPGLAPDFAAQLLILRADHLFVLGRVVEALAVADEAIAILLPYRGGDGPETVALINVSRARAEALRSLGRVEEAIEETDRAISIARESAGKDPELAGELDAALERRLTYCSASADEAPDR